MLALAGEGKNPAYEVFAAHYFSLRDLIHVLLRPTVDSKGVEHRVPHAVLATVKQSFIKMFHEVCPLSLLVVLGTPDSATR